MSKHFGRFHWIKKLTEKGRKRVIPIQNPRQEPLMASHLPRLLVRAGLVQITREEKQGMWGKATREQMEDVCGEGHLRDKADKTSQVQLCLHGPPIQCTTISLSFPFYRRPALSSLTLLKPIFLIFF